MADITKKVDRAIFPTSRSQTFTSGDAGAGDVLLIAASLGHPARHMTVEADGGSLSFRLNVYHTIFPRYVAPESMHMSNVASGQTIQTSSQGIVIVEDGTVYEFEDDLPINDLELVTVSGGFDIWVT